MNEIPGVPGVGPSQGPGEVRKAGRGAPPASPKSADKADSVEISGAAQFKAALGQVPDIRADKVAQIRDQIKAGDYLTDDKINKAIDRLLQDLF